MHGNLYRITVHQRLNTLGLVAVGQLVCRIDINPDFSSGCLLNQFSELASALCPGTGFCGGAGKVPGLLFPAQVTVILHLKASVINRCIGCKGRNQLFCIFIILFFQFFLIPLVNSLNCFFEGIYIQIFIRRNGHAVFLLPAAHDLLITGTIDMTFISNCFLTCLIYHCLLFRSQTVIQLLVDAEEQAVIVCVPQRTIRLHFLDACRIDRRKRILLAFHGLLLQCRIGLRPVHIGRVCTPALVTLHQQIAACHTDLQVFHIIHGFDLTYVVGQLTETIFRDTHAVQTVFAQDVFQHLSCQSIQLRIGILDRIKQIRQGYHIESRIKRRINQVAVHGNLHRIAVHQCLNSFRLIAVGQLVCRVNIDLHLAAGGLFHQLAELASALCPRTGLRWGTGEVPGLLFPAQIRIIPDLVPYLIGCGRTRIFRRILSGTGLDCGCTGIGTFTRHCFGQERGDVRNIGDHQKHDNTGSDHRTNGSGNLRNVHFHSLFQLHGNRHKQVYANRRCYLTDRQVYSCNQTKCNHIVAQLLTNRQHDRDKNIHGRVGINEASCNQENHIDNNQESKLIMCNASQQFGCRLRDTKFGADEGEQGCACHDQHDAARSLSGINQDIPQILHRNFPINNHTNKQTIHHRYRCRLGWSEDTAVDTAQNDHRHQESPKCFFKCCPALCRRCFLLRGLNMVLSGFNHNHNDQSRTHQNTRYNTCGKHIRDGNAGDGCVNDKRDARRNDDCDRACRRHQRSREWGGEAALLNHGRDQHTSQRRYRRGTGTGDRTEKAGNDNAHDCNTASPVSDTGINKLDQTLGDTGLCHNIAGQYEERNCQQQEFTDTGIHIGCHNRQRSTGIQDCTYGGQSQADADRNSHNQENEERDKQHCTDHFTSSFLSIQVSRKNSIKCRIMQAAPIGTNDQKIHSGQFRTNVRFPFSSCVITLSMPYLNSTDVKNTHNTVFRNNTGLRRETGRRSVTSVRLTSSPSLHASAAAISVIRTNTATTSSSVNDQDW